MEAVFCLRAALVTPFKRPGCLPFHPTTNLSPLGHLSFPRHYRVSCSHAQPPRPPTPEKDEGRKGRAGGRTWPRVAAVGAGAAFVVACALGSVCLTRPAPDAAVKWCTSWTAHNEGPSGGGGKGTMNTEGNKLGNQAQSEKTNLQNTREAVQQILFRKKDLSSMEKGQRKSRLFSKDWFQELEKYEAGMLLVKMLMDMAIICFTLTVEKMTSTARTMMTTTTTELKESMEDLVTRAKGSWNKYKELEEGFREMPNADEKDTPKQQPSTRSAYRAS
ncbi:uncharacterized protein LOC108951505 [Musa acuminata AAA Group]|uniref:uncharacterized protein LOC108951505 n=1 Tax=Musa acuminata AAA Group TaxID=214697 RepID=UPI0031E2D686